MDSVSGVGVLDKAFAVVGALEPGPLSLGGLVEATGLSRPTVHRLAVALAAHGMVARTDDGRFGLGPRLTGSNLPAVARPALERLREETGESVQLYVRRGDRRLCVASLESPHGLRTIVAVGASLPLNVGSAGKVLRGDPETLRRGWAQSVEEREPGVASVSAPVRDAAGAVVAAVSVSGPIGRTTRSPGRKYSSAVTRAAASVQEACGFRGAPGQRSPERVPPSSPGATSTTTSPV